MSESYSLEARHDGKIFRIEEFSPEYGFYLFIYENGECTYDYMQDTVEDCKGFAFEEFNVPLDCWKFAIKE